MSSKSPREGGTAVTLPVTSAKQATAENESKQNNNGTSHQAAVGNNDDLAPALSHQTNSPTVIKATASMNPVSESNNNSPKIGPKKMISVFKTTSLPIEASKDGNGEYGEK